MSQFDFANLRAAMLRVELEERRERISAEAEIERLKAQLAERAQTEARTLKHWKEDQEAKQAEIERLKAALDEDKAGMYARGLEAEAEIERLKDQLQRENAEHTACERIWRGGQEAAEARLAKVVETLGAPGYTPNCLVCGHFATIIGKALAAAQPEEEP